MSCTGRNGSCASSAPPEQKLQAKLQLTRRISLGGDCAEPGGIEALIGKAELHRLGKIKSFREAADSDFPASGSSFTFGPTGRTLPDVRGPGMRNATFGSK